MTTKFNIEIPEELKKLNNVFMLENVKLYLVGGAVRDALQNKIPKDYDIVTEANPNRILNILNKHNIKNILRSSLKNLT